MQYIAKVALIKDYKEISCKLTLIKKIHNKILKMTKR